MKKHVKILMIMLICFFCALLSSCGFVRYVRYEDDSLEATKKEYMAYIKALEDKNNYFEEEKREYIKTLIEVENLINEATSFEEIVAIIENYTKILGNIPLNIELTRARVYEQIKLLAKENLYREEQQKSVDWLVGYFKTMIDECNDVNECELLIMKFKTSLANVKTDAQLTAEELAAYKKELSLAFGTNLDYSLYRSAERDTLEKLVKELRSSLESAADIAGCDVLVAQYTKQISLVPKSEELLSGERALWQTFWRAQLATFADKYALDISDRIDEVIADIADKTTEKEANLYASNFMLNEAVRIGDMAFDDAKIAAALYVQNFADESDYREQERRILADIIDEALAGVENCASTDDLFGVFMLLRADIYGLKTNDQLWKSEDDGFLDALSDKHASLILTPPESLTTAKSIEELAKIIDFYAFYQIDQTSFERGRFRVDLDFPHNYAEYVIRDVYWYCELLRSAVGISGYFEEDTSNLVITLHPYDIATLKNENRLPEDTSRFDSAIEYAAGAEYKDRGEDFDAFPYLELYAGRYVKVWNSQQLWYALENEYIPIPVANSAAEEVLKAAESILRDIIKDGMSIEEKVFAIYGWYSDNVTYDYAYEDYMIVDDRENFPDSKAAALRSFHAEGALLDKLAVCCSYAKSTLILMRMEGIEAYRVILHDYEENSVGNFGRAGYGSHAIITLRASDGKFYYCDTEQCAAGHNLMYQKYHQLLVTAKEQSPYNDCVDRIWGDLDYAEEFPMDLFWDNLVYNGKSVFVKTEDELRVLIDEFCALGDKTKQINIFNYLTADFDVGKVLDEDPRIEYHYFPFSDFYEYMINYVGE